jgi:hypothetical protein
VSVIADLDVIAAYYHCDQPAFGAPVNWPRPAPQHRRYATGPSTPFASPSIDSSQRNLMPYAGFMFSQVNGGLANGYLNRNTIDPAVGLRFRF